MQANILAHSKEEYPIYRDENWLIEQYWGFELTTRQMAELCNCSQGLILKYMRKYEIPLKARFHYYRDQYGRKKCVKCGQWKEITEFYTNGKIKKKGYTQVRQNRCKSCIKEEGKQWAIDRQTNIKYKYMVYKSAAKKAGRVLALPIEDFEILVKSNCHYCGAEPVTLNGIDRLDNKKGYFLDNCVPCCPVCNWMKSDLSLNEFSEKIICLAKWALSYRNRGD